MNDTFIPSSNYSAKKWYIIDANQKPLGRISTQIASILQGKHKIDYHPAVDMGDYVIVINAEAMHLDSWTVGHAKYRVYSPGRPGSSLKIFFEKIPKRIVESAVRNMLPNGLRPKFYSRLRVYSGSDHPHIAQNPIPLKWN
jgi:large subunit ribosomal protein L13